MKEYIILDNKKKIVFLDRDGVINVDKHYLYKIEEFEFTQNLFETCKYFISLGYEIIIITNQSGIARKYYNEDDFKKLTSWMLNEFKQNDINILDLFYCPHSPNDNCSCRKPKPGMILQANNKYNIDLKNSWLIGDKISDVEAGINAGIKNTILITNEYYKETNNINTQHIIHNIIETKNIIKN